MSDLRPGTTMHRIAELERVTRELRQDIRELLGQLELALGRIAALEAEAGMPVDELRREAYADDEPEEPPLARRDSYIGTWSGQDVPRREDR